MIRYAPIVDPGAFVALDFFGSVGAVFTGGFFYILVRRLVHSKNNPDYIDGISEAGGD